MNIKFPILAVFAFASLTGSALAKDTVTLQHTVEPASYVDRDVSLDILGIKLGMTAEDAKQAMLKRFDSIGSMDTNVGTRQVSSDRFDILYYVWPRGGGESMNVHVTSPSAGSRVYAVSRAIDFDSGKGLPKTGDLITELSKKYGEPSKVDDDGGAVVVSWFIGGNGKCSDRDVCTTVFHKTGYDANKIVYDPSQLKYYQETSAKGPQVVIIANLRSYDENARVNTMYVSLLDLKQRALSVEADVQQINAAQDAFESKPVEMPEL